MEGGGGGGGEGEGEGGVVGGLARVLMKKSGEEFPRIHNLYSRATNETLQKKKTKTTVITTTTSTTS